MPAPLAASAGHPAALPRRLVLVGAFALALVVGLGPRPSAVAQEPRPAADATTAQPQDRATVGHETDQATGQRTITITKEGKSVTISGLPRELKLDRHFDSLSQIADEEPTLAWMVVGIVAIVFLAPVFAIALILAYRMRKLRMQNETMVRLAEKGIVPPAEAINALAAGRMPASITNEPSTANAMPAASLPPEIAKRAAWSDLRKGVVLGAIGLGLILYSLWGGRSPNGIGLVLFFVGLGYLVLWWLEDRQMRPRRGGPGAPPGAGTGNAS